MCGCITSLGCSRPSPEPVGVSGGRLHPGGYQVELFSEQSAVTAADVAGLWEREGVVRGAETQRRLSELLVVATDAALHPAGVSTTYLAYQTQLRAELWHTRVFVAAAHRQSHLAVALALAARDELTRAVLAGH